MPVIVGNRRPLAARLVVDRLAHHHEAVRIAKSKWPEQYRVDHAEDRSSRADAQRQRKDGCKREPGRLPQLTDGIADIASRLFNPWQAALYAVALADLRDAAKRAQRGGACLLLIHPVRAIFFDGQIDMRAQLFVENGIELPTAEECCETAEENADPVHNRLLIRRGKEARHGGGDALPVFDLLHDLLPPGAGQRVELSAASGFRSTPFGLHPPPLFQAKKSWIDGSLVEAHRVPTDLFDSSRNAVAVQRTHRLKRLQHHQIKRSLQYI